MKVLVIGSGGREHAIVKGLKKSTLVNQIFIAPGNKGMEKDAVLVPIEVTDKEKLLSFARQEKIDLTIVGPEASLETGIVDLFKENQLAIFGPTKKASRIETSKEYAKDLMKKNNIPTAAYETFTSYEDALSYVREKGTPIVIKYDGLAAGKGVVVALTLKEAEDALKDMLLDSKYGNAKVVIEEYLEGKEFSFLCFVDGENVYPLELSQDHKRAFDFDKGPNTGGMGAYSPLPFISNEEKEIALKTIMIPTAKALVEDDSSFTGVLYGGLMKTKDGIKVIEFNCRFGDPETEVVLPRLKSDLCQAFLDVINHKEPELIWDSKACLGVVLASKGYPSSYEKNHVINIREPLNGEIYYMGVDKKGNELVNTGGRVLIVVEMANTIKEALEKAKEDIAKIDCDVLFYRSDIGHDAL